MLEEGEIKDGVDMVVELAREEKKTLSVDVCEYVPQQMLSIQFEGKDSSSGQEGSGSALAKAVTRDSGLPGIDVSSASATVVQEGGRSSLSTLDISRKIQAGRINRQITVGVSLLQGIYGDCSTPTSNNNTYVGSEGKRMKGVVLLLNGTDAFVVKTRNKKTKNKEATISKSKKVVMPDSFANLDTGDMEAEKASTATTRADLDDRTGSLSRTELFSKEGTLSGVESCIKDLSSSGKEVRRVQSSLMEEESREYLRKGFEQVYSMLVSNTTPPTWEEIVRAHGCSKKEVSFQDFRALHHMPCLKTRMSKTGRKMEDGRCYDGLDSLIKSNTSIH